MSCFFLSYHRPHPRVSFLLIILFFKGWKNRKTQAVPEKSVPGGGEGDARLLLPQDRKALQGEGSEDIWGGRDSEHTPAASCCLPPARGCWLHDGQETNPTNSSIPTSRPGCPQVRGHSGGTQGDCTQTPTPRGTMASKKFSASGSFLTSRTSGDL